MKTFIFTIILYGVCINIFCQDTKPTVPYQKVKYYGDNLLDTLPYIWYETNSVPEWESEYFNIYSKVTNSFRIIIQDSFIYRVNSKREYLETPFLKGPFINGNYITKRNIYSGELIWQSHYSDVEAGRQEVQINGRINESGNLEVIGYRRARTTESNNFATGAFGLNDRDMRLFFREYDAETGALLQHLYPESDDPNAAVLIDGNPGGSGKLFFTPEDTTIRFIGTFRQGPDAGFISILMDRRGKMIGAIDTISATSDQVNTIFLTKNKEYVILENNFAEDKLTLHIFDLAMNPLRTVVRSGFKDIGRIESSGTYFDSDNLIEFAVFKDDIPPDFHMRYTFVFMDLNGNVIDSFSRKHQNNNFLRLDDGTIIGMQRVWNEEKERRSVVIFKKEPNKEMEEIKIYTSENNYFFSIQDLQYFEDKLIVSSTEGYLNDFNYRAASTFLFNLKDLGFPVSTVETTQAKVDFDIFPNPAADQVEIRLAEGINGILQVLDVNGSQVWKSKVINGNIETIYVSEWQSGMYFFNFVSDDGRNNVRKLVKI